MNEGRKELYLRASRGADAIQRAMQGLNYKLIDLFSVNGEDTLSFYNAEKDEAVAIKIFPLDDEELDDLKDRAGVQE